MEQPGRTIWFYFFFTASKAGKTGLTPAVYVVQKSSGSVVIDGTTASAVNAAKLPGLYAISYATSSGDDSDFIARANTSDSTVDFQDVASLQQVKSFLADLDATISSRSSHSAADVWASATRTLTDFSAQFNQVITSFTTASTLGNALNRLLSYITAAPAEKTDYTQARAIKLDDLDTNIASRAPANTALASADLANLDVAVSTRVSTANWPTALATLLQNFTTQRIANLDNLDDTTSSVLSAIAALPTSSAFVTALLNQVATSFTSANTVGEAVNNILSYLTTAPLTALQIASALPSGTVVARSSTNIDNTNIEAKRGDSWHIDFSGLGTLASRAKLYFTIKEAGAQEDNESAVQIEETAGLTQITHGSPTAVHGSITVTDVNAGDCTVYLKGVESAKLYARAYIWDLQVIDSSDDPTTLTSGNFTVTEDATRATS